VFFSKDCASGSCLELLLAAHEPEAELPMAATGGVESLELTPTLWIPYCGDGALMAL
jgi:hypothetical protein